MEQISYFRKQLAYELVHDVNNKACHRSYVHPSPQNLYTNDDLLVTNVRRMHPISTTTVSSLNTLKMSVPASSVAMSRTCQKLLRKNLGIAPQITNVS